MFYAWASTWTRPSLGLLATASGMVLVVNLLGWKTLRSPALQLWAAFYVATAVACGVARIAFPIEAEGPSILPDAIPLLVLPVAIVALFLLRLVGLWGAICLALVVLGAHILFSTIPPLKHLVPTLPQPPLIEWLAFGTFALMALSRWALQTSQPVVRVSHNLDHSLARAAAVAEERRYNRATPEHLLLALIDDPDAIPVMQACHVDIEAFRRAISSSLVVQGAGPEGTSARPYADIPALVRRAATRSVTREVNGARVLVEMLGEPVGGFLRQAGMTRLDATSYISHGRIDAYDFSEGETPATGGEQPAATGPAMLKVKLLNDDFTPMEFVVEVLQRFFDYGRKDATRLMLSIHRNGVGACGTYPSEIARLKVAQVREFARAHEHPLRCILDGSH